MIIKPRHLPTGIIKLSAGLLHLHLKRRFNKLVINSADIKPNCSYLLMCNHFSFWDGFLGYHLSLNFIGRKVPVNKFFVMSLKKQLKKNSWMRYFGSFSVAPYGRSVDESLNYAAEILNTPGNILLFFPQANLESMHVDHIELKEGIINISSKIKGDCQLIWSSNIIEYFESLKPSVYFHMLDCGSNTDFDFAKLTADINVHHQQAIKKQFRSPANG